MGRLSGTRLEVRPLGKVRTEPSQGSSENYLGMAQNETGGVMQALVHVSTYQGSILVPFF